MSLNISKVLVANRGEIAVRVIRAARELGLQTVAVYSDADRESMAVQMADEAVHIGPAHASKSYLNVPAIIAAARETGADALHPGYGFLAENAAFAQAVIDAGIAFVGPDPETIHTMGNKALARKTAIKAGVPVVPGSEDVVTTLDEALTVAHHIRYPVMIKAAAGGGGRGIRVARNEAELEEQLPLAQNEAQAAFGDGGVYLERFIGRARHVEVQVLGDGENAIHLFERECSLQRRRQKILEEAPSPALDAETRKRLCASAVQLAQLVKYKGAGTLEYLYDETTREFFFIEMNTRIQVEHPISELITGVDLVREMLWVAGGGKLRYRQEDIAIRGAAIECRINAEDPEMNFMPRPGKVESVTWPAGPGVRVDSMVYPGYSIPPFYDSMLAKLIVWDTDRHAALNRMERALGEVRIEGVPTTVALHQSLLHDDGVRHGQYDTNYLERWMNSQTSWVKTA